MFTFGPCSKFDKKGFINFNLLKTFRIITLLNGFSSVLWFSFSF